MEWRNNDLIQYQVQGIIDQIRFVNLEYLHHLNIVQRIDEHIFVISRMYGVNMQHRIDGVPMHYSNHFRLKYNQHDHKIILPQMMIFLVLVLLVIDGRIIMIAIRLLTMDTDDELDMDIMMLLDYL